jgi:hypothetical protein
LLILNGYFDLSGVWLGVDLRMDSKKEILGSLLNIIGGIKVTYSYERKLSL